MINLLKISAFILVVAVIGFDGRLLLTYWPKIADSDNFELAGPFIQGVFSPLVSLVTVFFAFLVISRQFHQNEEIEKIKQRMGERYKRESDAYFEIWNAASKAYRLLSVLEVGTWDAATKKKCENGFGKAEPYAFVLRQDHRDEFYKYWQAAEEALAKADAATDDNARKFIWRQAGPVLGQRLNRLSDQFREQYLGQL
jgi:hypothetical protein